MQSAPTAQFPELFRVRTPAGLQQALALGARARNMNASEYARQALLAILSLDGIRLRNGHVEQTRKADD